MSRSAKKLFIYLAVFAFVVSSLAVPAMACKLTAGYDEAEPYHFTDSGGGVVGSDADILREALKLAGCEVEFVERPWKRTLLEVADGELDIAIGAKYLDERAAFAFYSAPYKVIDHWLYTRAGEYRSISSLEELLESGRGNLGVVRGWGYPPQLAAVLAVDKYAEFIKKANLFEQLPKMLDERRLEGIIATPASLALEVEKGGFENKFAVRAKYEEPLHFLFSKKAVSPKVISELNAALFKLSTSGRIRDILKKYEID